MRRQQNPLPAFLLIVLILVLTRALPYWRRHHRQTIGNVSYERMGAADLYPDLATTPGAVDPRVTQENIAETICVAGWTKQVRPPEEFTYGLKREMLVESGQGSASDFELDHLIPLELGGCPDCRENLWLEPYSPFPGARQKDRVENFLRRQVCRGAMPLKDAQQEIASDWYRIYVQLPP